MRIVTILFAIIVASPLLMIKVAKTNETMKVCLIASQSPIHTEIVNYVVERIIALGCRQGDLLSLLVAPDVYVDPRSGIGDVTDQLCDFYGTILIQLSPTGTNSLSCLYIGGRRTYR